MLVPLLIVVAALAVALAALLARSRRLAHEAERTGARLAEVDARIDQATTAGRAALPPPESSPARPDPPDRRPGRRARRVPATPDRP